MQSLRGSDGFTNNPLRNSRRRVEGGSGMQYGTPGDDKFISAAQIKNPPSDYSIQKDEKPRRLSLYRNTPDTDAKTNSSTA